MDKKTNFSPMHKHPIRVYFEDTDAGEIVYYANYLKYAERARTEMFRALGLDHAQMIAQTGHMFVVRRCEVEYLKPAQLDDVLEVHSDVIKLGGASVLLEQKIMRGEDVLVRMGVTLVYLGPDKRPARLSREIRELIKEEGKYGTANR